MFTEMGAHSMCDAEQLALRLQHSEVPGVHMTGDHIDRIYKHGSLVEERVGHNIVVLSFLKLVMCLLKKQSGYSGIQYWAVGYGDASWDTTLPNPTTAETRLTSEIARVAIPASEIKFLNTSFNEVSTPTNIIQIKHLFRENDCNGVWREFGIFGGNATTALNSGLMINKRNHAVLTKTTDMAVERILRFTLSLT